MSSFSHLEALIRDPLVKLTDLRAYLDVALHHDSIDDRNMLLEKLLVLMARLSENGTDRMKEISQTMQEFAIDLLYKDLPHPPSAFLSSNFPAAPSASTVTPNPKYASRSADGSGYSPFAPIMGMAGAPYARSVPGLSSVDPSSLPAPELVFDALLGRPKITKPDGKTEEKFTPHPGGVNALFFAIADLIIHSCFNTSPRDWTINLASSYLDLSILYGSNEQELNTVRRRDGTGRLYEDVFGDKRLLFMPPASCALLVLLSRNHNYFAERILRINERGSFKPVDSLKDDKAKADQDDEIFARARLINCGFFMHIILGDYVGAILGMVRDGYKWRLDPLMEFRRANHEHSPRGEGNVVSIEFNLLYRWHSTLSLEDTKWTSDIFKKVLGDKDPGEVTTEEFHLAVRNAVKVPADPREWTFHGLKRDSRGKFDDSDLAKILQDSTKSRAAAYGAKGIPEAMRIIEILGIEQARSWGTCSLNEFRKFIGLKPYSSFAEWNSDPEVHGAAQQLYRNIDNLELHVGMQAEESKKPGPGAGLCPGYTISRAILADAVCLTRGDPYLTVNFTPFHFTTFGYNDCQYDHDDGTYGGGLLTKLLFRHLPRHYPPRSAYAHFPFFDPAYLRTLNLDEQSAVKTKIPIAEYAWDYPRAIPVVAVGSWLGVSTVLDGTRDDFVNTSSSKATKVFSAPYDWRLRAIIPDLGDKIPDTRAIRALLLKHKYRHAEWFARTAKALIASASISTQSSPVRHLDVIRDVLNVLPIKFIANELAGLPGTEGLYTTFRDVCRYVYVNLEPEYDWHLREGSSKAFEQFRKVVKGHLDSMTSWLGVDETPLWTLDGGEDARSFLKELSVIGGGGSGKTAAVVALFVELVPNAVQFSQALAHIVNYALEKGVGGDVDIEKVLREDPLVWGTYRTALRDVTLPDSTKVKAGDNVWLGIADAGGVGDGDAWMGVGRHGLLNPELFGAIAPGVLKEILTLPGLKKEGDMRRFVEERNGSRVQQYVDVKGDVVPFPDSLKVRYGK